MLLTWTTRKAKHWMLFGLTAGGKALCTSKWDRLPDPGQTAQEARPSGGRRSQWTTKTYVQPQTNGRWATLGGTAGMPAGVNILSLWRERSA